MVKANDIGFFLERLARSTEANPKGEAQKSPLVPTGYAEIA
jgi:hypothetical protein